MDINNLISRDDEGKIFIFLGPMRSGKTSLLIKLASIYHLSNQKVIFINNTIDTRNENELKNKNIKNSGISTHNKNITDDNIEYYPVKSFDKFDFDMIKRYDIVLIDECQFFDKTLINFVDTLLDMGKIIYLSGLDGDANMNPFGHVFNLIPKAYYVYKYRGICQFCLENDNTICNAPFTARIQTSNKATEVDGNIIDVGAAFYRTCCLKCHKKYNS